MSDNEKRESTIKPEWSYQVEAIEVSNAPLRKKISASPQQRKDLARRMGVISVDRLEADLRVQRTENKFLIHVTGTFKGQVTRECAVTAEPIQSEVEGEVEGWFAESEKAISLAKIRHEKTSQMVNSEVPILSDKDDPDMIEDGMFDLGELVVQHAILEVDPYPRSDNAEHPDVLTEEEAAQQKKNINNPFAALKDWKERQENGK